MNKFILSFLIFMAVTHSAVADSDVDDNPWGKQAKLREAFTEALTKKLLFHCPSRAKYGGNFACEPRGGDDKPSLIADDEHLFTSEGWQEFSAYITWLRERYIYHMQKPVTIHIVRGVFREPAAASGTKLFHTRPDGVTIFATDMLLKYYDTHGDVACDAVDVNVVIRADKEHEFKIAHFNVAPSQTNKLCDMRRHPDLLHMGEEPQILGDAPPPLP